MKYKVKEVKGISKEGEYKLNIYRKMGDMLKNKKSKEEIFKFLDKKQREYERKFSLESIVGEFS